MTCLRPTTYVFKDGSRVEYRLILVDVDKGKTQYLDEANSLGRWFGDDPGGI